MSNVDSTTFTIGAEEEYLLVNSKDFSQGHMPTDFFEFLEANPNGKLAHEVFDSHLESRTPKCNNIQELKTEITNCRISASNLAQEFGLNICSSGTVPSINWQESAPLPIPPLQNIMNDFSESFLSQSIAAFHVHTTAGSLKENLKIVNKLSWFVWIFLALSGSSRYYDGRDTGMSSRRLSLIGQTQRTGFPPYYNSVDDYSMELKALNASGWSANKLWYYVRVNPNHNTVELRVMDAIPLIEDAVALSALFLCLCKGLESGRIKCPDMSSSHSRVIAQVNLERAMLFGTQSQKSDGTPVHFFDSSLCEKSLIDCTKDLLTSLTGVAEELGCQNELYRVLAIAENGNFSSSPFSQFNALEITSKINKITLKGT